MYTLDTAGNETVLYNFQAGVDDGAVPSAGVIRDSAGNLYGTTLFGGPGGGLGMVFKVDSAGAETVLYTFQGGADGANPSAGVIRDSAGNLYGTTEYGGAAPFNAGSGVVYKLDTSGQETVLYTFTGGVDGGKPLAGVILDSAGSLYGTTSAGGTAGAGVLYKLNPSGHLIVLHSFTGGADGGSPNGVIGDSAGLYGTTGSGGAASQGVVFKVDTSGQETVLYSFTGGADGGTPTAGVIRDSAGNLYGTTSVGGKAHGGVVFVIKGAAAAE